MFNYDPVAAGDLKEVIPGQYAMGCKEGQRWFGWLCFKHHDGQWISLRKMTTAEIEDVLREVES